MMGVRLIAAVIVGSVFAMFLCGFYSFSRRPTPGPEIAAAVLTGVAGWSATKAYAIVPFILSVGAIVAAFRLWTYLRSQRQSKTPSPRDTDAVDI
jgi:hypothetical protein